MMKLAASPLVIVPKIVGRHQHGGGLSIFKGLRESASISEHVIPTAVSKIMKMMQNQHFMGISPIEAIK